MGSVGLFSISAPGGAAGATVTPPVDTVSPACIGTKMVFDIPQQVLETKIRSGFPTTGVRAERRRSPVCGGYLYSE